MRWTAVVIPFSIIGVIAYWNFNSRTHFRDGLPLRFDKTIHNFGEVSWGAPVEVTFRFFNASQQEVVIENITSSCACTVANLSSLRFRPGEFGVLTVRFFANRICGACQPNVPNLLKGLSKSNQLVLASRCQPFAHALAQ
jgi:hypothetical protein